MHTQAPKKREFLEKWELKLHSKSFFLQMNEDYPIYSPKL